MTPAATGRIARRVGAFASPLGLLPLLLVAALVAALTVAAAPAMAATAPSRAQVQRALDAAVAAGAPGATAVIDLPGGREERYAAGLGNLQRDTAISPRDRFRVGGVTKTFVAALVLELVDRHKLSLGDTVERWLPGLVPGGDAITVRELLDHTSGIQSYNKVRPEIALIHLARRWTQRELVEIGISVPPLFPPGESWSYTNTGYVLLGMIVQRATGESLRSELERRIFDRLGLTHTALPVTPHMAGRHSHGYFVAVPGPAHDVTRTSPTLGWGSGGIVSSPRDVNAFFRALMRGRLLPPRLMKEMRAPTPGSFTGEMESGLGLEHDTWSNACAAWGKAGAYPGFRTEAFVGPQGRRAATMYVNTWQPDTAGIAEDARFKAARLVACRMRLAR